MGKAAAAGHGETTHVRNEVVKGAIYLTMPTAMLEVWTNNLNR
jgi:hypothetical protein